MEIDSSDEVPQFLQVNKPSLCLFVVFFCYFVALLVTEATGSVDESMVLVGAFIGLLTTLLSVVLMYYNMQFSNDVSTYLRDHEFKSEKAKRKVPLAAITHQIFVPKRPNEDENIRTSFLEAPPSPHDTVRDESVEEEMNTKSAVLQNANLAVKESLQNDLFRLKCEHRELKEQYSSLQKQYSEKFTASILLQQSPVEEVPPPQQTMTAIIEEESHSDSTESAIALAPSAEEEHEIDDTKPLMSSQPQQLVVAVDVGTSSRTKKHANKKYAGIGQSDSSDEDSKSDSSVKDENHVLIDIPPTEEEPQQTAPDEAQQNEPDTVSLAEIVSLQHELADKDEQMASLSDENLNLTGHNLKLKEDISAIAADVKRLESENRSLERKKAAAEEEKKVLLDEKEEEKRVLLEEKRVLEEEKEALQQEKQDLEKEHARVIEENASITATAAIVAKQASDMKELNGKLKKAQAQRKEDDRLVADLKGEKAKLKMRVDTLQDEMKILKHNLGQKQSEMLTRSGAFTIDSKFPSVKELLSKFDRIKDTEHADCHIMIVSALKKSKSDWNPLFVTQYSHRFMFNVLIQTYDSVMALREEIYSQIGSTLQIDAIMSSMDGSEEEKNDGGDDSKRAKLEYVFHFYLQSNSAKLIRSKQESIFADIVSKNDDTLQILQSTINDSGKMDEIRSLMRAYVDRSAEVCWEMTLNQPELTLTPIAFEAAPDTPLDRKLHKLLRGSDRNSEQILYYAWPSVKRNDTMLDLQISVLARSEPIPESKPST